MSSAEERDAENTKIRKAKDLYIYEAYFGKNGYGSIARTYKAAHDKDPAITLAYVKEWFRSNVLNVKHPKGMNSFVAPHPGYEYQVDLFFVADLDRPDKPKKPKKKTKKELAEIAKQEAEQEQKPDPTTRRMSQKTKDPALAEPEPDKQEPDPTTRRMNQTTKDPTLAEQERGDPTEDIAGKLHRQKYPLAVLCIDIFSKFAVVVPIVKKDTVNVAEGIKKAIKTMKDRTGIEKPQIIYSDAEPAIDSKVMQAYWVQQGIKSYITRNHAQFSERFIRTYKNMLYKRIDSLKAMNIVDPQWEKYNEEILYTYNHKQVHSSTKMTPKDAAMPTNTIDVKNNLELRAKHNRKYPPLSVGDTVHILRKKKINEKERTSNFDEKYHLVSAITEELGQKYYTVEGRQYIRGEVFKVG
jgi:hypothetical protein